MPLPAVASPRDCRLASLRTQRSPWRPDVLVLSRLLYTVEPLPLRHLVEDMMVTSSISAVRLSHVLTASLAVVLLLLFVLFHLGTGTEHEGWQPAVRSRSTLNTRLPPTVGC